MQSLFLLPYFICCEWGDSLGETRSKASIKRMIVGRVEEVETAFHNLITLGKERLRVRYNGIKLFNLMKRYKQSIPLKSVQKLVGSLDWIISLTCLLSFFRRAQLVGDTDDLRNHTDIWNWPSRPIPVIPDLDFCVGVRFGKREVNILRATDVFVRSYFICCLFIIGGCFLRIGQVR